MKKIILLLIPVIVFTIGEMNVAVAENFQLQEDGPFKEYYSSGALKRDGVVKNGQMDGPSKTYYENGKIEMDGTFKDGKANGPYLFYYETGQLSTEGMFRNGQIDGPYKEYYKNGQLRLDAAYKEDMQEGPYKEYYENGMIKGEGIFKGGNPDGPYKTYYQNGKLKEEGFNKNGKLAGLVKGYDENGVLAFEADYLDGKQIGALKEYDKTQAETGSNGVEADSINLSSDDTAIIKEVLRISGIKAWLDRIPSRMDQMLAGFHDNSMPSSASQADKDKIFAIINDVYNVENLIKLFSRNLKNYYEKRRFNAYLGVLQKPLVGRILEREKAQSQMNEDQVNKEAELFYKKQPSTKRMELVFAVIAVENWFNLENASTGEIRAPMMKLMEPTMPIEIIQEEIATLIDMSGWGMKGLVDGLLPYHGFLLRNFSDNEIEQYIVEMSTNEIEYVHEAIYQALIETFAERRNEFFSKVNAIFPENNELEINKKYGALSPEETLEQKLKRSEALMDKAFQYQYSGKMDDAQRSAEEAISLREQLLYLNPDAVDLCVSTGIFYQMLHAKIGRSAVLLEKAARDNTDIAQVYFTLGLIYQYWNEDDLAEKMFLKTLEMEPQAPGVEYNLGFVYIRKGQEEQAVKYLKKAVDNDPEDSLSYAGLGFIAEKQGDQDSANDYFKKAKRYGLNDEGLNDLRKFIKN